MARSSSAGESHPHALTEPTLTLSSQPALIVQPSTKGLALSMQLLPLPVGHWTSLGNGVPSVQSHYRTFLPTTNPSAPVLRLGTLALMGAAHLSFSLRSGATGSHVPYQSPDQGHAASMPDAVWAVHRLTHTPPGRPRLPPVWTSPRRLRHGLRGSLTLGSLTHT